MYKTKGVVLFATCVTVKSYTIQTINVYRLPSDYF